MQYWPVAIAGNITEGLKNTQQLYRYESVLRGKTLLHVAGTYEVSARQNIPAYKRRRKTWESRTHLKAKSQLFRRCCLEKNFYQYCEVYYMLQEWFFFQNNNPEIWKATSKPFFPTHTSCQEEERNIVSCCFCSEHARHNIVSQLSSQGKIEIATFVNQNLSQIYLPPCCCGMQPRPCAPLASFLKIVFIKWN